MDAAHIVTAASKGASEDRYRFLFERMDDGFCIIEMIFDADGRPCDYRFLEHNGSFEQQTGLVAPLGKTVRELVPSHEQHWFDLYGEVALTGEPARFEQSSVPMNRWFDVYAFRLSEEPRGLVAIVFSDITARKLAERRADFLIQLARDLAPLAEEREIVRTAVSAVGEYLRVDRCYFLECMEASNLLVVSENWIRGDSPSIEGAFPLFDFGGIEWWNRFASGEFAVSDVDTHPLTSDKADNYHAIQLKSYLVQPFRNDDQWKVVLAVTDVVTRVWTIEESRVIDDVVARVWPLVLRARVTRELKESQQALLKSQAELERRVIERTEKLQETVTELESFSYSISHDLRAPLRAMQTYASILVSENGRQIDEAGNEYLRRITAAAERMDRLIQDVLVYSRVAQNELPLEPIQLEPFIAGIVHSYPNLTEKTSAISWASPLLPVRANTAALTQCISNLLGNAVKFLRPGVPPKIEIWTVLHEGKVRLNIRDNGVGIASALHHKIFGIFYQVKPQPGSTGIGLAVVRKAVERMGGTVGVESEPGAGSLFYLELVPLE